MFSDQNCQGLNHLLSPKLPQAVFYVPEYLKNDLHNSFNKFPFEKLKMNKQKTERENKISL